MLEVILCKEDADRLKALPEEHKSRIFTVLEKHFSKYDDLLKNPPSQVGIISGPQKDDL